MHAPNKAILLINIGSPNSYKVKDVRKYLRAFLMDKRVIDISWFFRFLLVNLIIVTFRAPKSAKKYEEIWQKEGSPLITHSNNLVKKLKAKFIDSANVYIAMRYGNPSIKNTLEEIKKKGYSEIVVYPLYPHNAASTTSSSVQEVLKIISNWENIPSIKFINEFWNNKLYISALATQGKKFLNENYDHVVISFHGLPLKQVYKAHTGKSCSELNCAENHNKDNYYCYQSVCYQTAKTLANNLNLSSNQYTVAFQSRLTKNWLSPFTDELLKDLVEQGKKNVLIFCPSFVADCLETIHEIEIEYAEEFKALGGEKLTLVPALNSEDFWVDALAEIITT